MSEVSFKFYSKCFPALGMALILAAGTGCSRRSEPGSETAPASPPASASAENGFTFGRDTLWDDGRAEVSLYSGFSERAGERRATEARIVIVKEDLLNGELVKSDRGPIEGGTFEALKQIVTIEFLLGASAERHASTTFLFRHSLEPLKEVASTFDGCGLTTVRIGPARGRMLHEAHSYWEGEADRVVEVLWALDGRPRVWRDALPLWLRAAVASDRVPPKVWMLPGQLGSRSPIEATRPVEASLGVRDGGALSRATGRADSTRLVVVTSAADTSRYWFDAAWPHVLLRWESNARTLELTKTLRLDYWTHDALADEALLR